MLTWVAVVLGLALVGVLARWFARPYDSLGRRQTFPVVLVVVLALPAVAAATPGLLRWREERTLERAASTLAGARVQVACQTFGEAFVDASSDLGWVSWGPDGIPEHRTLIKYEPCANLRDYLGSDKAHPSLDEVIAVHVLTHESMHMMGLTNEAQAECAAVQRDAQTARLLGADPFEAVELAQTYWTNVYPQMSEAYVSADCHPGGPLDEHLADPPWTPAT